MRPVEGRRGRKEKVLRGKATVISREVFTRTISTAAVRMLRSTTARSVDVPNALRVRFTT
jgi:hypothetical protein